VLKNLTINNVVLIDKIAINFANGLTILTGETGSGKSILLDALGLAIGFRSNSRLIGKNDDKASVIAEFDISSNNLCQEILQNNDLSFANNQLIIRRTISETSSNKIFINDTQISLNLLAKIGETLVEIQGQHEQRGLLVSSSHLDILDEFSDNKTLLLELKKTYFELQNLDKKIADYQTQESTLAREKDYLEHALKEISEAKIQDNEEEFLIQKKDQLTAKEKINTFVNELKNSLNQASTNLLQSQKFLSRNVNLIDNFLKNYSEEFESINIATDSNISMIDSLIDNLENILKEVNNFNESKEEIEERLFFIRSLGRKYNYPLSDFSNLLNEFRLKYSELEKNQATNDDFFSSKTSLLKKYHKIAHELSQKRHKSAQELAKKVEEELKFLKMAGTKFLVEITPNNNPNNDQEYFLNGLEKAKFKASLNNGDFDEISKIASGGELSRFMLALKVALIKVKSIPTIIFDEIDTGISGSTSDAVGKRLKILANNAQIFVVTHQPQIASKAQTHFKIAKNNLDKTIKTQITELNDEGRLNELARMLSGENISVEAKEVAKKLIQES